MVKKFSKLNLFCLYLNKAGQGAEDPVFAVHCLPNSICLLTGLGFIFLWRR